MGLLDYFISPLREEEQKPTGLFNFGLDDVILRGVENRVGQNAQQLLRFADQVAGMESDYNPMAKNPKSSAKGMYQLTDDSFKTAKNRLQNILGRENLTVPERFMKAKSVLDLSPSDQRTLFFAHLTEDQGSDARILDYLKGNDKGAELYEFNHYKGVLDDATRRRMKDFFQ